MKTSINKILDKKLYNNKTVYPFQLGSQYHNYNMNSANYFDPDSIRDDLIKTRYEYNKLNQSYQELKYSYNKLNNENIENLNLIAELCQQDNQKENKENNNENKENNEENKKENNEENEKENNENNNKKNMNKSNKKSKQTKKYLSNKKVKKKEKILKKNGTRHI